MNIKYFYPFLLIILLSIKMEYKIYYVYNIYQNLYIYISLVLCHLYNFIKHHETWDCRLVSMLLNIYKN